MPDPPVDEAVVVQGPFELALGQFKAALAIILISRFIEGNRLASASPPWSWRARRSPPAKTSTNNQRHRIRTV